VGGLPEAGREQRKAYQRVITPFDGVVTARNGSLVSGNSTGAYCQAELKIPRRTPSLILPAEAIIRAGLDVAVVEAGHVHFRKVTLVRDMGTTVEVSEGLKDGDRVILNPPANIAEGQTGIPAWWRRRRRRDFRASRCGGRPPLRSLESILHVPTHPKESVAATDRTREAGQADGQVSDHGRAGDTGQEAGIPGQPGLSAQECARKNGRGRAHRP
jgi:hypothetical protein